MWIYEHSDWPQFQWDLMAIGQALADIAYRHGRLLGRMEQLGLFQQQEARLDTFTEDVMMSSAIEGEALDSAEVRSSVARRLGMDQQGVMLPVSRAVEGIVEMTLDAIQTPHSPLTAERLFAWHAALFPTGYSGVHRITVAHWRSESSVPMQIISGPIGRERGHFEAPSANTLEKEMQAFLTWFNQNDSINPILRAAIAHLWFVTIHPFEDGNGRIARAISDMALARLDGAPNHFYSFSKQLLSERQGYYNALEQQQSANLDITAWLLWVLGCLGRAIDQSEHVLKRVLFKAKLWDRINQGPVNERQRLVINRLLEENFFGQLNTSKYAKFAKCSKDTALRDIQELKARHILLQNAEGGRSTSYRLTDDPSAIVCP